MRGSEPYLPRFAVGGHIRGALSLPGGCAFGDASRYLDADGRFRPLAELAASWPMAQLRAAPRVVFHCGTGWRSSIACVVAHLLGLGNVANLDGGLHAWLATGGAVETDEPGDRDPR